MAHPLNDSTEHLLRELTPEVFRAVFRSQVL
jgi:hypothetical protein